MEERFGIKEFDMDLVPRYNIAPQQKVATIMRDPGVKMVGMRWGFIPFWAKDMKIGNRMINARSEKVAESRVFKPSFEKKRCLIPVSGFYEWQKAGKIKRPMTIRMTSKEPFTLAGIYSTWKAPSEKIIMSCAILTTEPNKIMEPVHNRMPVILPRENETTWLDIDSDKDTLLSLLRPYEGEDLEVYEVSTYVNSPKNEGPMCTKPVSVQTSLG
jgi:putative SOS response-associated peptidase YedK